MAAGATLLPFTAVSADRIAGANDTLRIGVIGCGARGTELIGDLLSRRNNAVPIRIAAVCDICEPHRARAESLASADAARYWQDLVEQRDLDAIIVAAPDHHHAAMSIAAMESGKDIYCEKPMTLRLEEARAFRDAAVCTGRIVQIGAQETSEPQWHLAHDIIRSGAIGATVWCQGSYRPSPAAAQWDRPVLKSVRFAGLDWDGFRGASPERRFDPDRYLNWRKYWDYSNGIAGETFYHKLAALLIAVGSAFPERVSAAGGIYVRDGREVPDSFVMTAEYPGGRTIVLASSMTNRNGLPAVIRGREASLEFCGRFVKIVTANGASEKLGRFPISGRSIDASDEAGNREASHFSERKCETTPRPDHLDNWLRCIRSREKCVCNEEIGYQTMAAVAMAVESYRTGKTLSFDGTTGHITPSGAKNHPLIA